MNSFFETLKSSGKLASCAQLFDWLFNENRFDGYSHPEKTRITREVHKLLDKNKIRYVPLDKDDMSAYSAQSETERVFAFQTSSAEGRDFFRHIRNGIAHGHAVISPKKREMYVTLEDYYDQTKRANRSSYMNIPLRVFISILKLGANKGVL